MIDSWHKVAGDLGEVAHLNFEDTDVPSLLDKFGVDYTEDYTKMQDIKVAHLDDLVFWVSFTHVLAGIHLHEFHRWYVSDNGSIVRQYRIRGEEQVHG